MRKLLFIITNDYHKQNNYFYVILSFLYLIMSFAKDPVVEQYLNNTFQVFNFQRNHFFEIGYKFSWILRLLPQDDVKIKSIRYDLAIIK